MKRKHPSVYGLCFAAVLAAAIFTVAGCDTGVGGGNAPPSVPPDIADFGADAAIEPELTVTTADEWTAALATISDGGNDKNYIINVPAAVGGIGGAFTKRFGTVTGVKVSLRGAGSLELDGAGANGQIVRIGNQQTLILRGVTLKGKAANTQALVYLEGTGSNTALWPVFVMESGAIRGNTIPSGNGPVGAGVTVMRGKFIMNGGEISGNTANAAGNAGKGGGVYIGTENSAFTMNGGAIRGNTSSGTSTTSTFGGRGGGVYVGQRTTFTMNGGTIYGNTASGIADSSGNGGGVYVETPGGAFTMTGGTIGGNTASCAHASGNGGYGDGVYIDGTGTFVKTGGTVYGKDTGANAYTGKPVKIGFVTIGGGVPDKNAGANANTANEDWYGHAVFAPKTPLPRIRETTAGSNVNLDTGTMDNWFK